jgi:hypothetical protein
MPVKGLTQAEIDAATAAVVAAGGKSTDRANRLPGETATEANARITAAYKAQPKPELTKEGKAAGATMEFVRTGAGGVGTYKEIFPIGVPIPAQRTTEYGNVYDSKGNLVSGTGLKTGVPGTATAQTPTTATTQTAGTTPTSKTGTSAPSGGAVESTTPAEFVETTATVTEPKTDAQIAADIAKAQAQGERQSAYDLLYSQFKLYGLESLVEPLKSLITSGASPAEFTVKLRDSDAYQLRFAANKKRIANGFAAIDEATYLALEDKFQSIMQNYGLPESYYKKGPLGVQEKFEDLISKNVDPVTLEERVMEGIKINQGSKLLIDTAKQFYPSLTDGDFLAYAIDPKNALPEIRRKVTATEIGSAQIGAGLAATVGGAEELARAGVTGKQYQQAAPTIAEAALRGSQLADIYKQSPYTQQTAEQAILDIPGSAEALRKTKKLTSLETAAFSGSAGAGAIARDRAGVL